MAATFVRSRNGRIALVGTAVAILVVVLVLLLTGGGSGGPKSGIAAGSSSPRGGSPSSNSAGSDAGSTSPSGPTFAIGSVEDCLETDFGGDAVSDFPGSQSSIAAFHQASTVVDVESGHQGTLLFFASSAKAASALPGITAMYKSSAVTQPNGGNVIFIPQEDQAADDQVTVTGCVQ